MHRIAFRTAASSLAMVVATPALAQQDATPAPASAAPTTQEDDQTIVVTAQLREQRLVDVPLTVTAYNGEFLDRLGLNDFEEFSRFVPGFEVQNQSPNNPGFVIRGITSDDGSAFNEPRVTVFQDGVSISKSRGSYVELFDMERIEVVRGPQSTLYGRGALIGAVNLIQNKAEPGEFSGYLRGDYGNFDQWLAEGMINAPIGDDAAIRISGRYRQRDGFIDNLLGGPDFNSVQTGAIRGSFRYAPSNAFTVDIIGNYQEDHPNGTSFKSMSFNPTDPATGVAIGTRAPWTGATLAAASDFPDGNQLGLDRTVWGVTGLVHADLGENFSLASVTGYRRFHSLEIFDADGTSLPILTAAEDARGRQFSQELRLTYDNHSWLTAFVGASYFHENGSQRTPSEFDERELLARLAGALNGGGLIPGQAATDPAPAALFDNPAFTGALLRGVVLNQIAAAAPAGTPANLLMAQLDAVLPTALANAVGANLQPGHIETATNFARTNSFDVFADATFHLTDRFDVGVGLRYSHDDKRSEISSAVLNGRSILGGVIGALSQPAAVRDALLGALATPGAATIPPSALFPVPLFGLGFQPTNNNGDLETGELKNGGFSWRVNARYELSDNSSLYASYARGRRPEVLSATPPATPFGSGRFDTLDAETVDAFEFGGRTETRRLSLDGSVYYYHYNNFQTTVQQGTVFVVTNAGEATSYGFEATARWRPVDAFTLFATYAFNHSRFGTGVRDGNRFRLSPDQKVSLGATFSARLGNGELSFTPDVTWQSRIFFDDDNDRPDLQTTATGALIDDLIQDERQGAYALVNARLGYTFNGRFRIEGFVSNLFNTHYVKDAGNTGDSIGLPTFIAGEPRFYGVQASVRF